MSLGFEKASNNKKKSEISDGFDDDDMRLLMGFGVQEEENEESFKEYNINSMFSE